MELGKFAENREIGVTPTLRTEPVARSKARYLQRIEEKDGKRCRMNEGARNCDGRNDSAPTQSPQEAAFPDALRRLPMQVRHLCKGMSGSAIALPPLPYTGHVGVMKGHLLIEPPDLPTKLTQPDAKFWFFAGNERGSIPPDGLERLYAGEYVAATFQCIAWHAVPLPIAQLVVH